MAEVVGSVDDLGCPIIRIEAATASPTAASTASKRSPHLGFSRSTGSSEKLRTDAEALARLEAGKGSTLVTVRAQSPHNSSSEWRTGQDETVNLYIIEITI